MDISKQEYQDIVSETTKAVFEAMKPTFEAQTQAVKDAANEMRALAEHVTSLAEELGEAAKEREKELFQRVSAMAERMETMNTQFNANAEKLPDFIKDNPDFQALRENHNKQFEELRDLAYKDQLTGLNNRTAMKNIMENSHSTVAGMTIDIDDFKKINDTQGHDKGDQVLKSVAQTIRETCDKYGDREVHVFRSGGEEMHVMVAVRGPDRSTPLEETAFMKELAENIRKNIEDKGECTVSIGVGKDTIQLPQTPSPEMFKKFGDDEMYEAKRAGKNRVVSHDGALSNDIQHVYEREIEKGTAQAKEAKPAGIPEAQKTTEETKNETEQGKDATKIEGAAITSKTAQNLSGQAEGDAITAKNDKTEVREVGEKAKEVPINTRETVHKAQADTEKKVRQLDQDVAVPDHGKHQGKGGEQQEREIER